MTVTIGRRDLLAALGGTAAAWPLAARAQQSAKKMLRVGTVSGTQKSSPQWAAFLRRLAELGYQEGKTFTFDLVPAANEAEYETGYRTLAARELDIVLATGPEIALKSALAATRTLPIVMIAIDYDPFARGYVTSLARPSGTVTGVFFQQIELAAKRIQLVKDAFPNMSAATMFWDRASADQWQASQNVAPKLGLRLSGVELREPPYDYDRALREAPPDHQSIVIVATSVFFFRDRARIADFASRHRIPSMFVFREWVEAGGLLSYGPSITAQFVRVAEFVDRIAQGAKPADLPIEQPTKFELATSVIPIVFALVGDPVGTGVVTTLARPGGNLTGLSNQAIDLHGKRIDLLREVVPGLHRLAILGNSDNPSSALEMKEVQSAARNVRIEVGTFEIRRADNITPAFEAFAGRVDALYVATDMLMLTSRVRINSLALGAKLPTMHGAQQYVEAGGLMSYGTNYAAQFQRAADYVDKILRGTKPADIPVEQPTKFDLVVNLTTAKALGLTIPETLLLRADEVIE